MSENFTVEITNEEAWAVEVALMEYSKNPINEEHGRLSLQVYERIKKLILDESEKRLLESR